jgi:hypothetical protein
MLDCDYTQKVTSMALRTYPTLLKISTSHYLVQGTLSQVEESKSAHIQQNQAKFFFKACSHPCSQHIE